MRGGFSALILEDFSSDNNLLFDSGGPDGVPGPLFGVEVLFRGGRIDAALSFDSWDAGRIAGLNRDRRVGSRARILAGARWRALERAWGGIFIAPSVGWQHFSHSEALLNLVENEVGLPNGVVRAGTDRFNSGFAFKFGAGMMFYPSRWAIVTFELGLNMAETSISVDGGTELDVLESHVTVNVGAEFRVF